MTEGALQERPQGKEIILQSNQAGAGGSVPVAGTLGLPPRAGKARQNCPPPPKPQLKLGKPNRKADTGEQLRLPRYFISQGELKSEAHTHGTARRPESGGGPKPGPSFLIPSPSPARGTRQPGRDPAAGQGPGLVLQEGTGWLLSPREEAAGSGSILRAWPSAKRRTRARAARCAASPARSC